MRHRCLYICALLALTAVGCGTSPGHPKPGPEVPRPDQINAFATLYAKNCAACHGVDGKNGAAISLANPAYLALAGKANLLRITANGVPQTAMPAFARSAGGMLTGAQIQSIVDGMIDHWSNANALAGQKPPPYIAGLKANAQHGQAAFATFCARCHAADGRGGKDLGSIVDASYLALISDQSLRTTIIAGVPQTNSQSMPGWRGDLSGRPMTDQEVTDVVAWLGSQRAQFPGQPYSQH